jgi:hypothetical protein
MAEINQAVGQPVIDYMARDYESLLQAMRDQIPGKLPEWTDFTNEADFGNVLLELFAHIGDILSYYQDRVANESFLGTARTRRSVIEHLRLIGYELGTAAPAAATLSLSVPGSVTTTVTVSKGDAFATKSQQNSPSVAFEYTREAPLSIDFSKLTADPVTGRKVFGPAALDQRQTITVSGSPTSFTLSFGGSAPTSSIAGNADAAAVQAALEALSTIGAGNVIVSGAAGGPYTVSFTGALGSKDVASLIVSSVTGGTSPAVTVATTQAGGLHQGPTGGIPVEQGQLVRNESLGTSDGSANQSFPLVHPGLILRPPGPAQQVSQDVLLITQLNTAIDAWTLRDTLAFSESGQKDYTVQIDENDRAYVIFGDGVFGAIPPQGTLIRATYRVGGGVAGNVPAGAIATIVSAPQLALLGGTITNTAPATGGAERETIEHAVQQAPAVFRSLRRAVTATDYEKLALNFKGVGKVRAAATGWNQVTLYVAPAGGGKVSDVLERGLKGYLEDKRMLTQLIEVSDVDYVPIRVTAEISVQSFYVAEDVKAQVQQAAANLLAFDNVDFGQTIYLSKFYEETQNVPGVVGVNITEFRRGDSPVPAVVPKIELGPNEIPVIPADPGYSSGMQAQVVGTNQAGV